MFDGFVFIMCSSLSLSLWNWSLSCCLGKMEKVKEKKQKLILSDQVLNGITVPQEQCSLCHLQSISSIN
jgi:hypothetical protein